MRATLFKRFFEHYGKGIDCGDINCVPSETSGDGAWVMRRNINTHARCMNVIKRLSNLCVTAVVPQHEVADAPLLVPGEAILRGVGPQRVERRLEPRPHLVVQQIAEVGARHREAQLVQPIRRPAIA